MKIFLYILLVVFAVIAIFFTWFFLVYAKVPELKLDASMTQEEKIKKKDDWFLELEKQNKFNGALLISKHTKPLLMKGYGYTTHESTNRINETASFQLASVSKQFTAAAILLLKEQKKLDFDDYVFKYIEDFPYKNVTLRHLLNHTSGIPDTYMELAEKYKKDIKVLTNAKVVELITNVKPKPDNEPNEIFNYSNTNYVLLAHIVEIITNKTFEDFMKAEIFDPMGMKNTRIWNLISKDSTFSTKTDDMRRSGKGFKKLKPTFLDGVSGDGAVYSSVADLIIWDKFWYGNHLISDTILQEAFKKPFLLDSAISDYGFGWIIQGDEIWHNGSWLGANTFISRNPKTKTCIAILDNASSIFIEPILKELKKAKF